MSDTRRDAMKKLADAKNIYKSVLKGKVIFKLLDTKDKEKGDHYFKIKY